MKSVSLLLFPLHIVGAMIIGFLLGVYIEGKGKENTGKGVAFSVLILGGIVPRVIIAVHGFSIGCVLFTAAACVYCGALILFCWLMDKK